LIVGLFFGVERYTQILELLLELFFGVERYTQILELRLELNSGVERYIQILELLRNLSFADASKLDSELKSKMASKQKFVVMVRT